MSIVFENEKFVLTLGDNAITESLVLKDGNIDVLDHYEEMALFSLTEPRPFNNEIKLAHPNKKTTFQANRVRKESDKLIVGFELITFEAVVEVKVAPRYITFNLVDFIIKPEDFGHLKMTPPPVLEFRTIQLPIKNRDNFGEWLNVSFDGKAAVNVLAACPESRIDSERHKNYRVMYAEAVRDVKMLDVPAALIVSKPDELLDAIDDLECDYNLPHGARSRRSGNINKSWYWTSGTNPTNVDKHIARAKQAGFEMMCFYYETIFKEEGAYKSCSGYEYRDEYPNGLADLKAMLKKVKDAGITPGFHLLQTHIGKHTKYCTPVADHRLNLKRHFTLSKPLTKDDTTIYVEENPLGSETNELTKILAFGGEMIAYDGFTTEPPYMFTGCERGHNSTYVKEHPTGEIGGLLDVSEFCANSIYINQNSSLQDEIADIVAEIWSAGFEFFYFDGSEGSGEPYEINVPRSQYRIYKKMPTEPLLCAGAAKAHFSWHMMSGGNAFDTFKIHEFKEKIVEFPFEEAPRMANDFTKLNFGWWTYFPDATPDIYEYGTSLAASWNCPVTIFASLDRFDKNPLTPDNFEVFRRWEEVRRNGFLTDERKLMLRDTKTEHTLLINESGEYELLPHYELREACGGCEDIKVYTFERGGKAYASLCHKTGEADITLDLGGAAVSYVKDPGKDDIPVASDGGKVTLSVKDKRYLICDMPVDALRAALAKAEIK